jgi:hypothetical protein
MNISKKLIETIENVVMQVLQRLNLLQGQWRLGTVVSVESTTKLKVQIDGSETVQSVPCNPDITFSPNDRIFVININNNPNDKFAISKRAI